MAKTKVCTGCGYVSSEDDLKCPICGGHMEAYSAYKNPHNEKLEEELNGGYHNDFEEGRKTGDYCDRDLEKNMNGGQHIHNISSYVHQNEADDLADRSHPKTVSAGDFNINGKHIYEMDKKEILTIQAIASLIPIAGLIFLIVLIKNLDEYQMDEDIKRSAILTYIAIKAGEMALSFFN